MKRLFSGIALSVLGSLAFSGNANADCGSAGGGEVNHNTGTSLNIGITHYEGEWPAIDNICEEYVVSSPDKDKYEKSFNNENSYMSANVSTQSFGYDIEYKGSATGYYDRPYNIEVRDTLIFSSDSNDNYDVNFNICYSKNAFSSWSLIGYFANADNYNTGAAYNVTNTVCYTDTYTVVNQLQDLYFVLQGQGGGGYSSYNNYMKFSLDLPSNISCTSRSGRFPGCDTPYSSNPPITTYPDNVYPHRHSVHAMCEGDASEYVGNPINFALGFKSQSETDYSAGLLNLTRYYRSDATWVNGSVGKYWWHSYERDLTVTSFGSSKTAKLIDKDGVILIFTQETSSSDWVAVDSDVRETFSDNGSGGFILTRENNTKEHYNSNKEFTRAEFTNGRFIDLTYSGGSLSTVSDDEGNSLTFAYNSNRVSTVTTNDNKVFTYNYTGDNLTSVTTPNNLKDRTYAYTETNFPNALTEIYHNGSLYGQYDYDDNTGRAISTKHNDGVQDVDNFTVAYNDASETVTTTNALGKETTYHFDVINGMRKIVQVEGHASANCVASNKNYTYTAEGWLESKTDWKGSETFYTRDSRGNTLTKTDAVDSGEPVQQLTSYTYYDPANYNDLDLVHTITRDKLLTTYTYKTDGRVKSKSLKDLITNEERITTYLYDDENGSTGTKLVEINGPRTDVTDVTTFEYDAQNRLIKTVNALGHTTEILSFDGSNRPTSISDANGVITNHVYDAQGRITQTVQDVGGYDATTNYGYNAAGDLSFVKSNIDETLIVSYGYDDARRLTSITYGYPQSGNLSSQHHIVYELDAAGNITKTEYKDGSTTTYIHTNTFDELSRAIKHTNALNQQTNYAYDKNGNITHVTDAESNTTSFLYDALQRVTKMTDALFNDTQYELNDLDQQTKATDPRLVETVYEYNAFGEVTKEISNDRGTLTYTRDLAGNVININDGRGIDTSYTYDALNRVLTVNYGADATTDITYDYDEANCPTYTKGRICSVADAASGVTSYSYDALGNTTGVTYAIDGMSFFTGYAYDDVGDVYFIQYPGFSPKAISLLKGNNQQGRIARVMVNGTVIGNDIEYFPFGDIKTLTFNNGLSLTNTYNQAYRLTDKLLTDGTTDIINWSYSHDAVGNITGYDNKSYGYDDLYRLINVDDGANFLEYLLDATGNRLETKENYVQVSDYNIDAGSNRVTSIDSTPIVYDSGNANQGGYITSDNQDRSFTWNDAGQLETVSINGNLVGTYYYNHLNQRVKKVLPNGETTYFIYDLNGQLISEQKQLFPSWPQTIRDYVYLDGRLLAIYDANNTLTNIHTDHLDTPRFGTDASKNVVWSWDSDAFGNDTGSSVNLANMPLRFAGQYEDSESGLFYNWNRYYDPMTGRYISSDPIGLAGGLNTFSYAMANPIMLGDPTGHIAVPLGYVIWGGAILTTSACNAIPACKDAVINGTITVQNTVDDVADAVGDAVQDVIDWCNGNDRQDDNCYTRLVLIDMQIEFMAGKYNEMLNDPYDLFNKAYEIGSGFGKGTWVGHQTSYEGYRIHLNHLISKAEEKGCRVPLEAYEWAAMPAPSSPL